MFESIELIIIFWISVFYGLCEGEEIFKENKLMSVIPSTLAFFQGYGMGYIFLQIIYFISSLFKIG